MNRCLPIDCIPRSLLLTGCLLLAGLTLNARAQNAAQDLPPDPQRIPPISAKSQYGVLHVVTPPDILLNGQPARLSPGSRIRGTNNLMVLSGALIGQDLKVRYTLEPLGLVHEVWILTPREIAASAAQPLPAATAN